MITIKRKITIIMILTALITVIYLNIQMYNTLHNISEIIETTKKPTPRPGDFQITLVTLEDSEFTPLLNSGAKKAADEENLQLRIYSVKNTDLLQLKDYFQLSLLAGYDGIIIDGEDPELLPLINRAAREGIPVVTILSDLPDSSRISYVGINNHRAGFLIGRTMLKNLAGYRPQLAIFSADSPNNSTPAAEYLKIFGFKEAISGDGNAEIIAWEKVSANILEARQSISAILNKHPEINGIFTTQPGATVAAANIIARQSNNIALIGYGDSARIKDYLREGVITASVINNPDQIGYNAVKEINSYLREKKVNLFSTFNIQLIKPGDLTGNKGGI